MKCPVCERGFKTEHGLRVHFGQRHAGHPWPFQVNWKPNIVRKRRAIVLHPS